MGEDQVLWDRQDPADRRAFQDIPDHRVKQEQPVLREQLVQQAPRARQAKQEQSVLREQ